MDLDDERGTERRLSMPDDGSGIATAAHLGDDRVDVLYEEQGFARTEWYPVERVRVRRRVITEIQTIEVEVRREELVIEREDVPAPAEALPIGRAPIAPEPYVTVLHREVPYIRLEIEPYEQAAVHVVSVDSEAPVSMELQAEHSSAEINESAASLAAHGEPNRRPV